MARFSTAITLGGLPVIGSIPSNSRAYRKANSIFCPLGPAHSRAWILMRRKDLYELDFDTEKTIIWSQTTTEDSGEAASTANVSFSGLFIRSSERISPGQVRDDNAAHLVHLVDNRYLLNKNSDTGKIRINPRSYAASQDYLNTDDTNPTWQTLVTKLWDACGLSGSSNLPGSLPLDGSPEGFIYTGVNAWKSLCYLLDHLDCAVEHQITAGGTYKITQLGASQNFPDSNQTLVWDLEPSNVGVETASTLKIYFPGHFKSYGQEQDTGVSSNWMVARDSVNESQSVSITGSRGTLPLWDNLSAVTNRQGLDDNSSNRTTRASNRKQRYETRQGVDTVHRIHRGISSSFVPGGRIRACLWRNWGDSEDLVGGTLTEFVAGTDLITDYAASSSGCVDWITEPVSMAEREPLLSPDLGRRSYPNYPRIINIVQIYNPSKAFGHVTESQNGLFPGLVRRWVNGNLLGYETCVLKFLDWYDLDTGNSFVAVNGRCYVGRLSGLDRIDDLNLTAPVYTVTNGEQTFQANPTITSGQYNKGTLGQFKLLNLDLSPSTITVYANCDFANIRYNKKAVVSRIATSRWVAMPGEC